MLKLQRDRTLLFFDLDGTLVDSSKDIVDAANQARGMLGLAELSSDVIVQAVGDGVKTFVEKVFYPMHSAEFSRAKDTFLNVYREYAIVSTRAYPGIAELLQILNKEGVLMAVISNKPSVMVRQIMTHFGWELYFSLCLGGDSLERAKPDPMPLDYSYRLLSPSNVHQAVMVGDGNQDIEVASRFQIPSIWVSWGFNRIPRLKPDFKVAHPLEIYDVLFK